MCGICGVLSLKGERPGDVVLERMVATLEHRGPDDNGFIIDGPCGIGNTRLAILDLSQAGHQPMRVTHNLTHMGNTYPHEAWIAYNGEVYNFKEVRAALASMGHFFHSETDTETLLRAYVQYGSPAFIHPFRGMFAMAIWDVTTQTLSILRDRLGQKPLFYALSDGWLVFGSEIKALLAHPAVTPRQNVDVLPHYLAYGYPPAPQTLFEGIYSLPPGHVMTICLADDDPRPQIEPYWLPTHGREDLTTATELELTNLLLSHLRSAVEMRMISDVPLGAFLSGGLDSAAVVALMAQASSQAVKTFAIGFEDEASFDETEHARRVAAQYVTDHHEFIVKPQVIDLVDELVWSHDQPFGDSSAIPTYLVSKMARQYVTVALTGDGGDELFAGYERFRAAQLAEMYANLMPDTAHQVLGNMLRTLPESSGYRGLVRRANRFISAANDPLPQRYLSWVRYISSDWVAELVGPEGEQAVIADYTRRFDPTTPDRRDDIVCQLLDVNMRTYLPDDLLVKVDRTSMAVSLEARSPFLDHRLAQFAMALPPEWKLRRGTGKYLLKRAMRGILPNRIIDRKKHGFGVPVGAWFRGDLAGYVREVLLDKRALERGFLNPVAVRGLIESHQHGGAELGQALWTVLTYELWLRRYFD